MNPTISVSTDAPGLTARLRLPRHHVAQRNQAIADALELVKRLEALADDFHEPDRPTAAPAEADQLDRITGLVDRIAAGTAGSPVLAPGGLMPHPGVCRCDWGGAWSDPDGRREEHDALIARLTSTDPWTVANTFQEAITWEEVHNPGDGGIPPWCWPRFVALHNWPDPVATEMFVNAIRMARLGMHAWHAATTEQRAEWDRSEDV